MLGERMSSRAEYRIAKYSYSQLSEPTPGSFEEAQASHLEGEGGHTHTHTPRSMLPELGTVLRLKSLQTCAVSP